ncbi:unnamed protein product, partial [Discosporangium mesarthrocarpum]
MGQRWGEGVSADAGIMRKLMLGGGEALSSAGSKNVSTLLLEDNQGNSYVFYTFQDSATAVRMLETVQQFIREAREGQGQGQSAIPQPPPGIGGTEAVASAGAVG